MVVMEATVHPDVEKLRSFGQGRLSADEAASVEEHLADCDTCCLLLEDNPADSFVGRLRKAKDLRSADTRINNAGLTPAPADDEPFELADHPRYRVVRLLGQGGMGAVYLAEHRHMGRSVALKVINPDLLNHPRSLPRFQQEVRAAAKLDHPNIVAAYDADHAASLHFLVMEYVEGQNLADYLAEKGPLPVAEACHIIRQAALGLQHAHERGMVHRDIKPHNLMLTPNGQVKVLDFGLARFAADPIQTCEVSKTSEAFGLTGAGAVVGTTDYIAPEQARDAHGADGRADIYSLGCTLYHLLTGKPPFPEGSASEKLRRHATVEPRSLREQRADVPEGVATIGNRMMAKKPEDRYQSAAEVAAALDTWGRTPILPAKNGRIGILPHKARRILLCLAGVAILLVCGLVAAGVVRIPAGPDREIEIKTDDPNIEVIVKGDRIVRIIDPKSGKAYQLDRHDLTLSSDDPDGLSVALDGQRPIVIKRHGKQVATVRLQNTAVATNTDFRTPILPPLLEGRSIPKCEEHPSEAQVLKALPKLEQGRHNVVRITYDKIKDTLDSPRFFPLAGYARLHRIHWKCTVHFTESTDSAKKPRVEVVYIDKDHLHLEPQKSRETRTGLQQAAKDFSTAEFYERTKKLDSAFHYYQLVRERFPDSVYAAKAKKRMAALKELGIDERQAEPPEILPSTPKITPFRHIKWSEGERHHEEISANGRYFLVIRHSVSPGTLHSMRVWDTKSGKVILELCPPMARFTPDGNKLIACRGWNKIEVYDLASGKQVKEFDGQGQMYKIFPSSRGNLLLYCGMNTYQVWDWHTGKQVCKFPWVWETWTPSVRWTPDGRHLLVQPKGKSTQVLNPVTGKNVEAFAPLRDLPDVQGWVLHDRVLCANGRKLKVYEATTGAHIATVDGGPDSRGTISADGSRLLSTGNRRDELCVWDVDAKRLVARLHLPEAIDVKRLSLSLSRDGQFALVGGPTDSVYVFRLTDLALPEKVTTVRKMPGGNEEKQSEPPESPSWADKLFLAKGSTSHDFGTVPRGTQLKHRFRLKNIYNVPLAITTIRTSAGCITWKESAKILKPYEEGYVDITMNTRLFLGSKTASIYVTVGPQYISQAILQVSAVSREEQDISPEATFFNGKNLFGWQGLPGYWKVHNGAIVGAPADGVKKHTFLCSEKTYRDFELKFKVKRKGGIGNSGVQIRSTLVDAQRFTVKGPQIEIDSANFRYPPGSIVTEPVAKPFVKANAAAVADVWKDEGFNDMTIRCEGKWVTVTINGVQVLDTHFPSMPAEGIIAWQLHGGTNGIVAPEEVIFKDIHFTDLSQQPTSGYTPLFNGKDLTGWKNHPDNPGDWSVEHGVLVGRGPAKNSLYTDSGHYEDFHLRVEAKIDAGGNSGLQFRKAFTAKPASSDGYEAQIDCDNHPARTGSLFVKGGTATVKVERSPAPADTWFTQEVIARGNHIIILVNGKKVVDYVDHDRTWRRGHLALQLWEPETVVRFRKIEVKKLVPHAAERSFAPLFKGEMNGWIKEGGYARTWQVENGELIGTATGYPKSGFILSPKSYTNFRLRFQYQLSAAANSGVAIRAVPGETTPNSNVPLHLEVQLLDDGAYRKPDGKLDCPTGSLFWGTQPNSHLPPQHLAHRKAAGAWNKMEIELRGQRLQVWVNGQPVRDTDLDDLAFRAEALPGLKRTAGRIGFQQHTGQVRFRNIVIEELSGSGASSTSTSGYRGLPAPDAVQVPSKRC